MIITGYHSIDERGRVGLFLCECGCAQEFFSHWTRRPPKYANRTHRQRAYRARAAARIRADSYVNNIEYFMTSEEAQTLWDQVFENQYDRLSRANRGRM